MQLYHVNKRDNNKTEREKQFTFGMPKVISPTISSYYLPIIPILQYLYLMTPN